MKIEIGGLKTIQVKCKVFFFFCKYIKKIRFQNHFRMKSRINDITERVIVVVITM